MKRTPIHVDLSVFPDSLRPIVEGADLYDSSCSPEARVLFINRDLGYFLKKAPAGSLKKEADLTRYFHKKGLAAPVLSYVCDEYDWLLTQRVLGEDLTHKLYLDDPKRLCDVWAEQLRQLHETDASDCPVKDRTAEYLALAHSNYRTGKHDLSLFPDGWGFASAEQAFGQLQKNEHMLKSNVLIHGDYCLPNVIFDDWRFSGYIDLGNGGVGDRHIDVFWGVWTLNFNLKTDKYTARFLDAYGRDAVSTDLLRTVAAAEVFG